MQQALESSIIARVNEQLIEELPKDLYITPEALRVFLEMFEGPLDLLLYLIKKQNLDILSIPIAKITDQYLCYINAMQTLNIDLASEYLLMAAVLLELKSRMLLPKPQIMEEDTEEIDPRQKLIQQLIEYEQMKIAAKQLDSLQHANRDYMWLQVEEVISDVQPYLTTIDLQKAWQRILRRINSQEMVHTIKKQAIPLREHMTYILRELYTYKSIFIDQLFKVAQDISYVVVTFIAVLELAKESLVTLEITESDNIQINLASNKF